jgi:polysaccharide export outer membrane protein
MLGARVALAMALAAMLSACALAPGQHMATPPTLPATTADNGDVTSDMQIPVKQIDLALIREIRADQKNDAKVQSQLNLFAKPAGYKLGSGGVLQITYGITRNLPRQSASRRRTRRPRMRRLDFVVNSEGNIQFESPERLFLLFCYPNKDASS